MPKITWSAVISNLIAFVALIFSALSFVASWEATSISREAYKRSSGRIFPLFTVGSQTQHLLVVGGHAVEPETVPIEIKNDGSEAIEAIRYEIRMDTLWSGDGGHNQPIKPSRFTHEFSKILQPGETTSLDIAPDVVAHIKALRIPERTDSFWTPCSVNFSPKLVGSPYYASATEEVGDNRTSYSFGLTWDSKPNVMRKPLNFGVDLNSPK